MSAAASPLARARSFLFVPGDRPERLPKALASGAHAVIADLEDAVAPEDKPAARHALARAWAALAPAERERLVVRINAPGTAWYDDDMSLLRELAQHKLAGVMLPKAESVGMIDRVAEFARSPVLPLVESAQGLHALDLLVRAPGVLRLAFGHLDFQADLGLHCDPDERELDGVRLAFVMASRRGVLPAPVDGVTAALDDEPRLAADVARSRRLGFGAKLCIHPRQVANVNEGLRPTQAQRAWARRVLEASRTHGTGAFRLDGQMIDAPVLQRARQLLADDAFCQGDTALPPLPQSPSQP
jgi:citrate lyase subunit beta/citryl-CoA lyase